MKIVFIIASLLIGLLSPKPTATISTHIFTIDIAKTPTQQEVGLAKYQNLPSGNGMYFPFAHSDYYAFWMKDMHFPIDIIFINNGKIVTIFSNVKPEKNYQDFIYKPTAPSNAVLEINAGLSQKYGFKNGDPVIISY